MARPRGFQTGWRCLWSQGLAGKYRMIGEWPPGIRTPPHVLRRPW